MAHFGGLGPHRGQQRNQSIKMLAAAVIVLLIGAGGFLVLGSKEGGAVTQGSSNTSSTEKIEMVEVLIPVEKVEAGVSLSADMFRLDSRPRQGLSPRAVRDFEEIKGFYSRTYIAEGSPVLTDYITPVRPVSLITPKIPDGYRAVTIKVNARSAVEGWARPGARVDVSWITRVSGRQVVKTIVHNAEVLSADLRTASDKAEEERKGAPSNVTLLVTNPDAQKILLAAENGGLSLTLRGDSDAGTVGERGTITLNDLLEIETEGKKNNTTGSVVVGGVEYEIDEFGRMQPKKK